MSQPVSPAGLALDALSRHLESAGVPVAAPLRAEIVTGGRSNLTYRVTDGSSRWILRRPPLGELMPGTHDVSREYRVLGALAKTAVPVPEVVLLCRDPEVIGAPFYLMKEVPGVVLRTPEEVAVLPPAECERLSAALVDTLADLHLLDYAEVGLSDLGRPAGYLERQLRRWVRQYRTIEVRSLPAVDTIAAALGRRVPDNPYASVIHGDYRLDNVIVTADDPRRIAAVLDWEMATLGDPLADLATLVMFWDEPGRPPNPITGGLTAAPGFFDRATVIERYVSRMGLAVDDVDWYLVFAQFRLAVILEQIHARELVGQAPEHDGARVGDMVPAILDAALADMERSPRLRPLVRRDGGAHRRPSKRATSKRTGQ